MAHLRLCYFRWHVVKETGISAARYSHCRWRGGVCDHCLVHSADHLHDDRS